LAVIDGYYNVMLIKLADPCSFPNKKSTI